VARAVPGAGVGEDGGVTLMWEARAAEGRLPELVGYVVARAAASAQVFRADGAQPRVVVIDPTGRGVPDVPAELLARAPHEWHFEAVERDG
jgi:hypothetical protein